MSESDASEHSLPYVQYPADDSAVEWTGEPIKLAKLSATDRATILRNAKAAARADLLATAKEAGIDNETMFMELRDFGLQVWGTNRWLNLLADIDAQGTILRVAIEKQNPGADADALLSKIVLGHDETLSLVCAVAQVPFHQKAPPIPNMRQVGTIEGKAMYVAEDAEKEPPADPTAGRPASYGK